MWMKLRRHKDLLCEFYDQTIDHFEHSKYIVNFDDALKYKRLQEQLRYDEFGAFYGRLTDRRAYLFEPCDCDDSDKFPFKIGDVVIGKSGAPYGITDKHCICYEWGQTLDKGKIKEILGDNLVMYFYDCYDVIEEKYLPQDEVIKIVSELGLTYVPIFYHGDFITWEHCASFVGKTELGGEYGEGVVIKNISRLNDPNGRLPFYTKIVGDKFIETKGQKHNKPLNPEALAQKEAQMALASTIVTKARVEKILHKFVDENILPEDWSSKDMPIVAKHLTKAVYEDCLKEEKAPVDSISDFGKIANGISMRLAREILNAKCSPVS